MVTLEDVQEQRVRVMKELKDAIRYLDGLTKPGELPELAVNRRLGKYRINLTAISSYDVTRSNYTIIKKELDTADKELRLFKKYKNNKQSKQDSIE